MNNPKYWITLDLNKKDSQVSLSFKRGEQGKKIYINLTENGKPYQITKDCYAMLNVRFNDSTDAVLYNCQIDGNTIVFDVTNQFTSAVGKANCEISLNSNESNAHILSAYFSAYINESVFSEIEEDSESDKVTLTSLIAQVNQKLQDGDFNAGFAEVMSSYVSTGEPNTDAIVTVTTDPNSPNTEKKFIFDFTIPRGADSLEELEIVMDGWKEFTAEDEGEFEGEPCLALSGILSEPIKIKGTFTIVSQDASSLVGYEYELEEQYLSSYIQLDEDFSLSLGYDNNKKRYCLYVAKEEGDRDPIYSFRYANLFIYADQIRYSGTEAFDNILKRIQNIEQFGSSGGGSNINVDNALSDTSINPVQNKVLKEELDKKADKNIEHRNWEQHNRYGVELEGKTEYTIAFSGKLPVNPFIKGFVSLSNDKRYDFYKSRNVSNADISVTVNTSEKTATIKSLTSYVTLSAFSLSVEVEETHDLETTVAEIEREYRYIGESNREALALINDLETIQTNLKNSVNGKLDIPNKPSAVGALVFKPNGTSEIRTLTNTPTNGWIAIYGGVDQGDSVTGNGRLITGDPKKPYHCTPKIYVDNLISRSIEVHESNFLHTSIDREWRNVDTQFNTPAYLSATKLPEPLKVKITDIYIGEGEEWMDMEMGEPFYQYETRLISPQTFDEIQADENGIYTVTLNCTKTTYNSDHSVDSTENVVIPLSFDIKFNREDVDGTTVWVYDPFGEGHNGGVAMLLYI